jgi:RHS repeat-associated protein
MRYYGGQPMAHTATTDDGATTTIDYDGLARINRVTSPVPASGAAVTDMLKYDSLGRIVKRIDSETGTRTYSYGPHGVLDYEIDPMGQKIVFGWDVLHRQTSQQTYALVDGEFAPESLVTVTYDVGFGSNLKGQAATASVTRTLPFEVDAISYGFGYDAWGRQASQAVAIGGKDFPFDLTYDPMGRPLNRTYPSVNGARPQATYNFWESYGGLSTVGYTSDSAVSPITYMTFSDYNARGQAGAATYANGVNERWNYFNNGLLMSHEVTEASNTQLINERAGWNQSNQLSTVLDCNHSTQLPCPAGSGGSDTDLGASYTYELLRLHTMQDADGTQTYCYDNAGNLVQSDGVVFTYDGNQVIGGTDATTPNQCDSDGQGAVFSAQYDTSGHLYDRTIQDTNLRVTTGVEGWLLQTELADKTFQRFTYDYTGQRVAKTVYGPDGTTIDHVVIYPAPDFEITLTNGGVAQYTLYLMGPGGRQVAYTEPLAGTEVDQLAQALGVTLNPATPPVPASTRVFHLDQVGSTQAVTDADGAKYAMVSYDAWGQPTISPAANATFRPLYGGYEFTEETGLYYANARYLDTFSGRFVSADTQVAAGPLVPDAFNDYAYALNNPVLYADPSGHFPIVKVALGVLVGVGLAASGVDVLVLGDMAGEAFGVIGGGLDEGLGGVVDDGSFLEARPVPDESMPLRSPDGPSETPLSRTEKAKKHGANLLETMVQSELVNTAKYSYTHKDGSWNWKSFGYSSGVAALGGLAGYDAGVLADIGAGTGATKDKRFVSSLIRGPIQGAVIADMGRELNHSVLNQSSNRSWVITTGVGGAVGFVFSPLVFGFKGAIE